MLVGRLGALAAPLLVACSDRPSPETKADSGVAEATDLLAHARSLADSRMLLPSRSTALGVGEALEARAVREGAGTRAVEMHGAAARLVERLWRIEGRETDANEALLLYRAAGNRVDLPGACEAAFDAARLVGAMSHDATAEYAELYRVERRFLSMPSCGPAVHDALALLTAFRPPQGVLDAIDAELARDGMMAPWEEARDAGASTMPSLPPKIASIESWPSRDEARVVVVLDRPAAYRIGDELLAGAAAPRTFLDLDGVDVGSAARDTPAGGIVQRIHAEATSTGARVVLDLDARAWRRVFYMHEPYRIVVDVARHPPGSTKTRGSRQVARVVLDPGHGGRDVGAVGPVGTREKDVTLDIAHRVAPILAADGIQVVLTRDDDRFVSLEERTARANAFAADLFVSVHCNASEGKVRRGVETYILDLSRDEIAARVAARENATTQAASAELGSILAGMRMADDSARSMRFAQLLQRASMAALRLNYGDAVDGGVHAAGFYVLVGARMPSVLFESSYVSNAVDEQRLASGDGRQLFADAIANAIVAYREGR